MNIGHKDLIIPVHKFNKREISDRGKMFMGFKSRYDRYIRKEENFSPEIQRGGSFTELGVDYNH